jgi:hypothetical protein
MTMNTNLEIPQWSSPIQVQDNQVLNSFDFERWAREVRPQLLAALQKRSAHSQQSAKA